MRKSIIAFVLTLCLLMSFPVVSGAAAPDSSIGVIEAQAATVKLNKTKLTLIKGQTYTLKVTGTKKTVKWSSSSKSVATVSSKGKVTAKKKGSATISAKVNGKTYKCKVTVETPSISKTKATLAIGKTTTLSIKNTTQKVSWKSSNTTVATVSTKGKVTAKKKGTATITATVGSLKKKYTCKITVKTKKEIEFSKLTTAINEYGKTDNDGNKHLYYNYIDSEDNYNAYYIEIINDILCFFLYTKYDNGDGSTITVKLPKSSNTANVEFDYYADNNDYEPSSEATTLINVKTWNKESVTFNATKSTVNGVNINRLANENLVFLMNDVNVILDTYEISINNLGFEAYG